MPVFGTVLSNATVVFSQWTTAGSDIYYTGGNVGIGITLPTATAHFKGSGATNATYGLKVENSASVLNFFVDDSGAVSATQGYSIDGVKFFYKDSGGSSLSIGMNAGNNLPDGSLIIIGRNAGATLAIGSESCILIGDGAGTSISTGNRNIVIGTSAGAALDTGSSCVLIGWHAGNAIGTVYGTTVAIGYDSLSTAIYGANTAIGYSSGSGLTTGYNNTFLGYGTSTSKIDAIGSIAIGHNSTVTADNQLMIGSAGTPIANAYIGTSVAQPDANLFIGSLQTVQGGLTTGAGIAVRLGRYFAGAVAADGNYVEMEINGVVYKLATAV